MTKSRIFKKLNIRKWLLVNFKINLMPPVHVVDRYLETVKHLDVVNDQQGLDFFINDRDDVPADWLPEPFQKRYVVVAIGGKFATKRLPLSRLIELCDRINKPIVLIGGKEDAATGAAIEAFFQRRTDQPETEEFLKTEFGKKAEVFNGCGKFTVGQSASIIKQAMVVFAHDTGMMHIAAAFRKTIYTIWGNTVPSFGMYPYQTKFVVFENNKINCRPCTKIGKDQCPKGHFKCMNEVVFDFYLP